MQVSEGRGYAYQRTSFGPEFMLMTGALPLWIFTGSTTEVVSIPSSVPAAPSSRDTEDEGNPQQR
jgi:hypothetical protein